MVKIKLTVDVEGLELELISRFQEGYFDDLEEGGNLRDAVTEYVASNITNYTDVYVTEETT